MTRRKKGVAVICVGEDLDVLLELCDKILVLNSGKSCRYRGCTYHNEGKTGTDDDWFDGG